MTEVASLYARVSANVVDFERGMKSVASDLEKAEGLFGKMSSTGEKVFTALSVGAVAAGGAIVGAIAKSVSAAADLEQQGANISAVFGKMAPPVDEVKKLISDLSLDPTLVVGVEDAGRGIEMLAKNGLAWSDIANGAARSSILLANATGADLATSADIATNAMSIFGLQTSDLNNVVATFVNAANMSQFGVEDWGYALANAGPKAAAFGFNLDELYAAMTLTSGAFASGQQMGTSWAWMINGLVPNTDKATVAMKELGLITDGGANAFFNADGTGKDLNQVISLLQGAFNGLTTEQKMAYSRVIFGQEAFGALSGVLGISQEELAGMTGQMTDFSAVEAGAETRTSTFKGAMEALNDTIGSVFTLVGEHFLPAFTKLARSFAEFIKNNAQPVIDFFGRMAQATSAWVDETIDLSNGTGDLWAKLQSLYIMAEAVWKSIVELVKPITDAIAKFVSWKDVVAALGILMGSALLSAIGGVVAALWPVISTVAAVTAAVAGLRWAWQNDFMGIQTYVRGWLDKLSTWFYQESGIWQGTWEETLDYLKWWADHAWRTYVYFKIRSWFYEIRSELTTWSLFTQNKFAEWKQKVSDTIEGWKNDAIRIFTNWKDRVVGFFNDTFGPTWKQIEDWVSRTKSKVEEWKKHWEDKIGPWKDWLIEKFQGVLDWWKTNEWLQRGRDIIQGLRDGIEEKWNNLSTWFSGAWGDLTTKFKRYFDIKSPSGLFAEYGENIMDGLAMGIESAANKVYGAMDTVGNNLSSQMSSAMDKMKAITPYSTLADALGTNEAYDFMRHVENVGMDARKALKMGNIAEGNIAYHYADALARIGDADSALKNITQVRDTLNEMVYQLNHKGAALTDGGAARTGLQDLVGILDEVMGGGSYDSGYYYQSPNAPSGSYGSGNADSGVVVEVLKLILQELRNNGSITDRGLKEVGHILSRSGGENYGALVNFLNGSMR